MAALMVLAQHEQVANAQQLFDTRGPLPRDAHFSVLTEMTQLLIAPVELMGYTLLEHMLPDISHGKMFCKWLREAHGIDTDVVPTFCTSTRTAAVSGPRRILSAFWQTFAGTSVRNGCRTARSTISGVGTAKPFSICRN
ncbi:hypothetical protein [Bradyrhizobium sp. McL0616]|uniref:hypothetical protein n=1 Tax=Bradyrhizobium sp. McL0616 TaxID=3415674 RepID=UPI003CF4DC80